VKVLQGPLHDQIGLLAALRPHERVLVLLQLLGGQQGSSLHGARSRRFEILDPRSLHAARLHCHLGLDVRVGVVVFERGLWIELQLSGLDLREVEHLVDEAKQVSHSAVHYQTAIAAA
jgi:hypothetical protein